MQFMMYWDVIYRGQKPTRLNIKWGQPVGIVSNVKELTIL